VIGSCELESCTERKSERDRTEDNEDRATQARNTVSQERQEEKRSKKYEQVKVSLAQI